MIVIDNILVSDAVVDEAFVCDLTACKGACCVLGDEGATVTNEEIKIIENSLDKIKPYMTSEGIAEIEKNGIAYQKSEDQMGLNCVDKKACVFVNYDKNGVALCGIENAYNAKKIDWKKPLSCHLYPIRIDKYKAYDAVNYYEWKICKAACALGNKLKVKVYQFLKEPLIRAFGEEFYTQLDAYVEQKK